MKKSYVFYTWKDWQEDYYRGDDWIIHTHMPTLYHNKQHLINLNRKFIRDCKKKKEDFNNFIKKVKVTIEDI